MIGTMITIWLVLMGAYYLFVAVMRLALKLPAAVVFVVCLPAMPFIVAYRNRQQHPTQAKTIYCLWSVIYAAILVASFIG